MKATGKKITIKTSEYKFVDVPVMRNGKPTSRTKRELESFDVEKTASSYEIEGHEVYIIDEKLERIMNGPEGLGYVYLYKKDGKAVVATCKFGRYGQTNHRVTVLYFPKQGRLGLASNGYNGATGKGWGATVKNIEWEVKDDAEKGVGLYSPTCEYCG